MLEAEGIGSNGLDTANELLLGTSHLARLLSEVAKVRAEHIVNARGTQPLLERGNTLLDRLDACELLRAGIFGEHPDLISKVLSLERVDGELGELLEETALERAENDVSTTLSTTTASSSDAMGVLLRVTGVADLDNARRARVVDTTSRDIRSDKDRGLALGCPEGRRGAEPVTLLELGVDLKHLRTLAGREVGLEVPDKR